MDKRALNCLEKYGVSHPMKLEYVKEKRNNTCLEKYGVPTPFQSEELREKAKETSLKKYGSEFYSSSEEGREAISQSHKRELEYNGDFYSEDEVKDFCREIDSKYLKSGGYRTLIKNDKKMFFSILNYSQQINFCENITFRSRVYFLQGKIKEYKCPECGEYYCWNNTEFVFKMKRTDKHFKNKWDLEYYTRYYGESEGLKKYNEYLKKRAEGTEKTKKMKVNSKQFYVKKYGENEGTKRYLESVNNRLSKSLKAFSKSSQNFFETLVTECKLDKNKCFYATNNGEKTIKLDDEYSKILNQSIIRPDFIVGNKIIEYNGMYWHRNSSEKDFFKKRFLESIGFEVLTVWENEEQGKALKRCKDFINKDRFLIKTQSGYSEFKGIRKLTVPKVLRICFNDTHIDVSEDHRFVVFGTEITAKTLKVGDILQTETGTAIITEIQAVQEQKDVYDVLDTKDHTYITNGIISHNCDFIGSSHTLISPDILKELKPQDPEMILANRLKVYKEPEEKHKYIMGVDPAKFGSDSFAIQVLDVTTFPFIQVASAKLPDENFQIMPQYLYEWGKWYNEALMIIESNDGAGTYANTVLHNDYEYENLYFEKTFGTFDHKTKTKIEPGFRTNAKNRAMILDTLKLLIDNKRLIINDKDTIKEFTTFVLKNNKFQADDGFHDDLIMALCIALAPFSDVKNFENFTELVNKMYSKDAESVDFSDFLCLGDFDDYSDLEVSDDTPESILFEIQSKSLRGF